MSPVTEDKSFSDSSNLADHFKRNHFWIKSQYGLYIKKFRNVPENYLTQAFQDYLINELEWLPTIKQVVHYMTTQRNDFKHHWHSIPVDETYCEHCRTDDEGKTGGFREVYFYGFRQSLQKKAEAHYKEHVLVIQPLRVNTNHISRLWTG